MVSTPSRNTTRPKTRSAATCRCTNVSKRSASVVASQLAGAGSNEIRSRIPVAAASRSRAGSSRSTSANHVASWRQSLRELRRARRLVISDPEIMGGDPVFRGTRVPVHMTAELVVQDSKPDELIDSYPRLTAEMIRLAPVYAAAYPLRGRPRRQPWRDQQPVRCRRLATITVDICGRIAGAKHALLQNTSAPGE
jgi:uncharacterized protein (DUF433 family)